MSAKLEVLKKLEEWLAMLQPALLQFPKASRFTLAQRIENTSLELIDLVVTANLEKARRSEHILRARVVAERLQILIRVARQRSFLDVHRYEVFSERIVEIAKMLAGWARVSK